MKVSYTNSRLSFFAFLYMVVMLAVVPGQANSQSYSLVPKAQTFMKVTGTSNVHSWDMTSTTMQSKGDFKFDKNHLLTSIQNFQLSLDAKTLKSKHSSLDNRAYKVMKASQHPKIVYNLRSTDVTTLSKNKYLVKVLGDLTIAGSRQVISMDVNVQVNADNSITCTGTEKIKLSDYNIAAPSYMAGTMKVGNDLTIGFAQTYHK
ncbi:YceI family protein [Nibribacter koreensis]|uniref:Lipid/polyisoprenoid-binding YceI-like domain-containing protein n=1 Tax=Nibribacter koreensis TaxID=1084519 RepID=A0ABP8FI38_9BACT